MLRICALGVILLAAAEGSKTTSPDSGADFPPQDQQILWTLNQGLTAKLAARRLAEAPDSPETIRVLAQARNTKGILEVLRTIVDKQRARIAEAFEALRDVTTEFRADDEQTRERAATLRGIVADGRKQLETLPGEDAARAERIFVTLDGELSRKYDERPQRLTRFVEQYRGTEAALLAEVDIITSGRASQKMFDDLDAFIASHPGTTAAAKALYMKGFQWHTINTLGTLEPRGADPTNRFLRVLEIVKDLESGRHPKSEWVTRAPSLVTGFFFPMDTKIPRENANRIANLLRDFAISHPPAGEKYSADDALGYMLTSKIARLFEEPARVVLLRGGERGIRRSATDAGEGSRRAATAQHGGLGISLAKGTGHIRFA